MKRPIVHLQPGGALESTLHQAATAALRQGTLTGSQVEAHVAERARLAEEAARRREMRRAREAAELRSFAES